MGPVYGNEQLSCAHNHYGSALDNESICEQFRDPEE